MRSQDDVYFAKVKNDDIVSLKDMKITDVSNLKEETRPTLYRGLKYWGKKPHNIWRDIIKKNTVEGDVVYDPFAGTAITFFESIKIGRKPVVADINPLTLFLVKLYSIDYDIDKIKQIALNIIAKAKTTDLYLNSFVTTCSRCHKKTDIYNYRVFDTIPEEHSYKCKFCGATITEKAQYANCKSNGFNLWKPILDMGQLSSINTSFIKKIGGKNITKLWTDRNIELLSFLFAEIKKIKTKEKDALMFAFLQMVHLTTKMCALRSKKSNRPLSTSWGRPAFLALNSYMEQNPIIQFERAVFGKNGVIECLLSRKTYLPQYRFSTDLKDLNNVDGVVLLKDSKTVVKGFKPQLVITDPPYGSTIQYGELSEVWNIWLQKYDPIYKVNLDKEIIINNKHSVESYIKNMTKVLLNCKLLLYPDGKIIMTFNSNSDRDWEALDLAIKQSDLKVLQKIYQKNCRSSEANVGAIDGIGISDFYLSIGNDIDDGVLYAA